MKKMHSAGKPSKEIARTFSAKISDPDLRKRSYALGTAALALAKVFKTEGFEAQTKHSLFKVSSFAQNFEIADIEVENAVVDVRVIFEEEKFFIPNTHKLYGYTPDFYFVISAQKDMSEFEILGYVQPRALKDGVLKGEYTQYDVKILNPLKNFKKALKEIKPQIHTFSSQDHQKISELCLGFIDEEIIQSEKVFFIKHVLSCPLCRERLCEFNEFDAIINQVKNYPELFDDNTLDVLTGIGEKEKLQDSNGILESGISSSMFEIVKDSQLSEDAEPFEDKNEDFESSEEQNAQEIEILEEVSAEPYLSEETAIENDELPEVSEHSEENSGQETSEGSLMDLEGEVVVVSPEISPENTQENNLETLEEQSFNELEDSGAQESGSDEFSAQTDVTFEEITLEPVSDELLQEESEEQKDEETAQSENLEKETELLMDEEFENIENTDFETPQELDELAVLESETSEEPLHEEELQTLEDDGNVSLEKEAAESDSLEEHETPALEQDSMLELEDLEMLESEDQLLHESGDTLYSNQNLPAENEMSLNESKSAPENEINLPDSSESDERLEESSQDLSLENNDVEEPLIEGADELLPAEDLNGQDNGLDDLKNDFEGEMQMTSAQTQEMPEISETIENVDYTSINQESSDEKMFDELDTLSENETSREEKESYAGIGLIDDDETPSQSNNSEQTEIEYEGIELIDEEDENMHEESQTIDSSENPEIQELLDDELLKLLSSDDTDDDAEKAFDQTQEDDTIGALYENNADSSENSETPVIDINKEPVSEKTANFTKKFVTAVIILALIGAGALSAFYYKFQKDKSDAGLSDLTPPSEGSSPLDTAANLPQGADEAPQAPMAQDLNKSMTNVFSQQPSAITITKISWEVSQKLASDDSFKNYLQVAGKNLQLNLQNDLSYATDVTYNPKIRVSLEIGKDNAIKRIQTTESSGSEQIDNVVLQSIKETLKYINVPDIKDYKGDYNMSIVINF